jgi:hypothetical protein
MRKILSVFLVIAVIAILSLTVPDITIAQSIPRPSVPQFTLQYFDKSYNDTRGGTYVEDRFIEVTIPNPTFTKYNNSNGNLIGLYYNYQWKNHSQQNWNIFTSNNRWLIPSSIYGSNKTITILELKLGTYSDINTEIENFTSGSQVDIQVKSAIGYYTRSPTPTVFLSNGQERYLIDYFFTGQESDWSGTQTITIPTSSTSPSPTSTVPEFSIVGLCATSLLATASISLVYLKKHKPKTELDKKP